MLSLLPNLSWEWGAGGCTRRRKLRKVLRGEESLQRKATPVPYGVSTRLERVSVTRKMHQGELQQSVNMRSEESGLR
jgi:hypothetical protein